MKTVLKQLVLTSVFLASMMAVAHADIIFLKDGRALHVKVLSGDEKGVSVERLDTQGRIFVRWELLREVDRKALRVRFGLDDEVAEEELVVDGHRIEPKRGDYYDGIVVRESQEEVVLKHRGRELPFKRHAIRKLTARPVSVFDVYTEDELYEQKKAELAPTEDDVVAQFEMGKWAAKIGKYARAMIHYARVRELEPDYKTDYIENQLKRLDYLEKNKFIRDKIKEAVRSGTVRRFKKSMETFDQILAEPTLEASLREEVEKLKVKFTKRRWRHYSREVTRGYFKELDRRLRKLASSKDIQSNDPEKAVTIDRAMSTVRSKLHKEIVEALAMKFELDPKKEVEKMWMERRKRGSRTASYGDGTFIVKKGGRGRGAGNRQASREDALRRRAEELLRRRGRRGGQQQQQQVPQVKLLTKAEWWKRADSTARFYWLRAYFAENGKQVEVVTTRTRNCTTCGGTGSLRRLGPQGGFFNVTCPRCQGHKSDRVITYR